MSISLIPPRFKCLSGSVLKLLAVLVMLVDRSALALFSQDSVAVISLFGIELTRYRIMRDIGRMAFPIFAFLLTEGFVHTSDRRRYGERLLAFALISEIPGIFCMRGRFSTSRATTYSSRCSWAIWGFVCSNV